MSGRIYISLIIAAVAFISTPVALAESFTFKLEAARTESYAHPHDIVLSPDGKKLYVADNGNHRIAVLDVQTLEEIGIFGRGEVREPHDVAFDRKGRLLVADTGNSRIAIYEVSGTGGRLVGELMESMVGDAGATVSRTKLPTSCGAMRLPARSRASETVTVNVIHKGITVLVPTVLAK